MNNKGQSVLSEHVMVFFIAVAAIVGMTTLVQRGFEARIHDVKTYVMQSANAACDANCQQASGGVGYEYEPYYAQTTAFSTQNSQDTNAQTSGSATSLGSIFYQEQHDITNTTSVSIQLPPVCASGSNGGCQLQPSGS